MNKYIVKIASRLGKPVKDRITRLASYIVDNAKKTTNSAGMLQQSQAHLNASKSFRNIYKRIGSSDAREMAATSRFTSKKLRKASNDN